MKMISDVTNNIKTLGQFCGIRDIDALTQEELFTKYNMNQVDVAVLFGGSILAGGDEFAKAIQNNIAKKYIIVGGAGHTTQTFREKVHQLYPEIETTDLTEAEIFQSYLQIVHGCKVDYLETKSTNCGNNVTYLLDLLRNNHIECKSILMVQDASMQRRMDAVVRRFRPDLTIINYAAYTAHVVCVNDKLTYDTEIHGMWDIDRYVNLLMGEIPRLTDDKNGYGPNGADFIAHVDIPDEVKIAFDKLKSIYKPREANSLYASNKI